MTEKQEQHRRDPQYKQAKRQGYRARSAFKLLDIQKRYNIFKRAFYILDLGSVPGSWLQVAKKFAEENLNKYKDQYYHRDHYKIMGVDIKKISPLENIKTVKMDITTLEFQNEIEAYFKGGKIDLILSDVSINKSGNKFSDHVRQINLCFKVVDIIKKYLKPKGVFVVKAFQGSDFNGLLKNLKSQFRVVKTLKPKSSNKLSNETYIICLGKK